MSSAAGSGATCARRAGRTRAPGAGIKSCPRRVRAPPPLLLPPHLNSQLGDRASSDDGGVRLGTAYMERGDCQFTVVPPGQYDEGGFMQHRQVMVVGGGDQDPAGAGRGAGERKRRFTEEQVRSLETTFHARRARLEPREKAELARELGLQPRQVAIWFQNKRARWRSKQLEHDYAALRARFDALHARVEELKQEKLALAAQLDELRGRLNERQDQSGSCEVNGAEADDKRNIISSLSLQVQEQDDGATPTPPAVDASEGSAATGYYDGVAYDGLPEPFCAATPDLWDTWPLLEWNAVA